MAMAIQQRPKVTLFIVAISSLKLPHSLARLVGALRFAPRFIVEPAAKLHRAGANVEHLASQNRN
jgi:hypothetical protein